MIHVTINAERVITGWARTGGLSGAYPVELDEIPTGLALGYYTLSEPPTDAEGQPLEPYEIAYDQERHRVYRSTLQRVPPELCKPWFDLETDAWIETATPEELAAWVPPQPPKTLQEQVQALQVQNASLLMDAANKDIQISGQNAMIADLMLQVAQTQTGGA